VNHYLLVNLTDTAMKVDALDTNNGAFDHFEIDQ
jgi:hypothetical protein